MKFTYQLVYNESDEFEWRHGNTGTMEAADFQDFVTRFYERYQQQLNEILDWECDDEEQAGSVAYGNSVDGMTLRFDVIAA